MSDSHDNGIKIYTVVCRFLYNQYDDPGAVHIGWWNFSKMALMRWDGKFLLEMEGVTGMGGPPYIAYPQTPRGMASNWPRAPQRTPKIILGALLSCTLDIKIAHLVLNFKLQH